MVQSPCRVLDAQLLLNSLFYETKMIIIIFATVCNWTMSWAR